MLIWDEGNLRAIGSKKDTKRYTIEVNEPFSLTIIDQDVFYTLRSLLIRNKIKFTEQIIDKEDDICKN